ncbi:hypothetical protein [Pleomorphomonas sp. NRK KF1]|uniref:pPIWI-associating nuclease domain-containing protein n=1 Tax=Pleomorphomonas sp. NRK KF1 TaxID=2943000 RepID=UPI00204426DB|nr:hypothetical protein [Pleomorphomonas sp. NRK KF1]MCM5554077.1 hypothetical protein [Pleomorphomonas sp. NRK KF1]
MDDKDKMLRQKIVEAVQTMNYQDTQAWSDLDLLSTSTQVDTVETFEKEIRFKEDEFQGPLTWYVVLRYGMNTNDPLETSESFPGTFRGRIVDSEPVIDDMTVDTSSFHGEIADYDAPDF